MNRVIRVKVFLSIRRYILIIVIFFVCSSLFNFCSVDAVKSDQLILHDGLTCTKSDTTPFTGLCKDFYEDGKLKLEKNYKEGLLDGLFVRYFENGQVNVEVSYKEGNPLNGFKQYYKSGKLKAEKIYKGDYQILTRYLESGEKTAEINFENNLIHGKSVQWFKNGNKEMEANYKHDKHDGMFIAWHSNGQKKIEGNYLDDKMEGQWIQWNEQGVVTNKEYYRNGMKDSLWTFFFDDGTKRLEVLYRGGLIKRNTEWNSNGDIISNFEAE